MRKVVQVARAGDGGRHVHGAKSEQKAARLR